MVIRMDTELRDVRSKLHHREMGIEEALIRCVNAAKLLTINPIPQSLNRKMLVEEALIIMRCDDMGKDLDP